jgi:hypothetical protein
MEGAAPAATRRLTAAVAVLAGLASLLPNPGAIVPRLSYYFRDFTVTFYPLRVFAAREWQAGRWPLWNPFIHEGSFALPILYPPDLLHVLWSGPAGVSWLLTLHLPLAALAAFALARELGGGRLGAFVTAVAYSAGGLALSSLNLYVYLQTMAWAPLVVLSLRRAAARGGRWVPAAAAVTAVSLTTLALEFVAQAVLLGLAIAALESPRRRTVGRLLAAVSLGTGLAFVPIAIILGFLGETVRGAGFESGVALGNELHPVVLLQVLVPNLFGPLAAPAEVYWGGPFFTKGFPYFLSLYLGPLVVALAAAGTGGRAPRWRAVLLVAGLLGLWFALGSRGGLATLLNELPFFSWFRFPVKAVFWPYLAAALLAGRGADRLRGGEGWGLFAAGVTAAMTLAISVAGATAAAGDRIGRLVALPPALAAVAMPSVSRDAWIAGLVAGIGLLVVGAVRLSKLDPHRAALLLASCATLDLVRAGWGMNPQVTPRFFESVPELQALGLARLDGGRVFTYGVDWSPAFREFLSRPAPSKGLWSFFVTRQILSPYANIFDRVELGPSKDLTSFVPRPLELLPEDYQPAAVATILSRLRQASVTRVLSLDALEHPDLHPIARIPAGPPGLDIHAYRIESWPRMYVACRIVPAADAAAAYGMSLAPDFDPRTDVALEGGGVADCRQGTARQVSALPMRESYEVAGDGAGYLVVRASYARGWHATLDGRPVPVVRANGKHRAVGVPAGPHRVELSYVAPGRTLGLAVMGLSLVLTLAGWVAGNPRAAA